MVSDPKESTSGSSHWFWDGIRSLHQRHERLKTTIHSAWRYPLPPAGRAFMGFVYFCIPVVGGWYIMQWAISKSHQSIGEHGEYLPVKTVQGIGDKRVTTSTTVDSEGSDAMIETRIGAGGWGGGVHLAVSDEETQRRNRKMLNKFLKQQRRNQGDGEASP